MRRFVPLFFLGFLFCACRGTQAYTSQDLAQVRQGVSEIKPTYIAFRAAYHTANTGAILSIYRREQVQCRIVDEIDRRDTIDPNVNLFQASIALDSWCNDIEAVYALWAKAHGLPYAKDLANGKVSEHFDDGRLMLKKIGKWIRHPAKLS